MTIAWILGRGGLLGTALHRTLVHDGTQLFAPGEKLCWSDEQRLGVQLAREVRAFSAQARGARRWEIYWAAGIGVMASPPEALAPETRALALRGGQQEAPQRLAAGFDEGGACRGF